MPVPDRAMKFREAVDLASNKTDMLDVCATRFDALADVVRKATGANK
jgi:hypothetical protein